MLVIIFCVITGIIIVLTMYSPPQKLFTGDVAPAFELYDQNGTIRKLSDYKARNLIVFFYPLDDSPT